MYVKITTYFQWVMSFLLSLYTISNFLIYNTQEKRNKNYAKMSPGQREIINANRRMRYNPEERHARYLRNYNPEERHESYLRYRESLQQNYSPEERHESYLRDRESLQQNYSPEERREYYLEHRDSRRDSVNSNQYHYDEANRPHINHNRIIRYQSNNLGESTIGSMDNVCPYCSALMF